MAPVFFFIPCSTTHLDDGHESLGSSTLNYQLTTILGSTQGGLLHRLHQEAWLYPPDDSGLVFHASGDETGG